MWERAERRGNVAGDIGGGEIEELKGGEGGELWWERGEIEECVWNRERDDSVLWGTGDALP